MTPQEWLRALDILSDAGGKTEDDQRELVRRAFPDDIVLQREVLTLLHDLRSVSMRIPEPALAASASPADPVANADDSTAQTDVGIALAPGEMCGRYKVIKELGRGGMGVVYLAEDTLLEVEVALKIPSARWIDTPAGRTRLKREAQRAAKLRGHPHVATVLDVIEVEVHRRSCSVLVMEYVEGRPANEVIRGGVVRPQRALAWAIQIADALEDAHTRGILHCDLKPGNVIITADDKAKVVDFGLARAQYERFDASEPLIGTVSYMAPEQLLEARFLESGDTYALGVTLFELLARRPPFVARVREELLAEILAAPIPNVSELASGIPKAFDPVLQRALAKQPHERYQSAREFREELSRIARELGFTVSKPDAEPSWLARTAMRLAMIAAVVLGTLLFVGYVSSTTIDMALGRTGEFVPDPQRSLIYWGFAAMVPPVALMMLFTLAMGLAIVACQLLYKAVPAIQRVCAPAVRVWKSRLVAHSDVFGQLVLLAQITAIGLFWFYFLPVITAMMAMSDPQMGDIHLLAPSNAPMTDFYRMSGSILLYVSAILWGMVAVARRREGRRLFSFDFTGGLLALVVNLFLLSAPYQLLNRNHSERVIYRSNVCYVVARSPREQRLFCPLNAVERLSTRPLDDPDVQKTTGQPENIFTPLDTRVPSEPPDASR